jgi:pimeloyl-ACP methyl ester carboxylesterase
MGWCLKVVDTFRGLSDKPEVGYDTATLANDVVGLMDALGHKRFAAVGVDTGMLIGYARLKRAELGRGGIHI